jgi:glycerophosphoryl diester phosphodiesterase
MNSLGKLRKGAVVMATSLVASVPLSAAHAAAVGTPARNQVDTPIVIGHRGAPGYRPEHTLEGYRLAIRMGADYIEPDLVSTKDGVLVARHENDITGTTDVAEHPEFAARRTTKTIDGNQVTGWFTEDFTLAELRTLRAKERLPLVRPGNTRYDGRFQVPTFDEVLDLAQAEGRRRGTPVGVYPETKHPTYFDSIGLSLEEPLAQALQRHGLDRPSSHVFVQSFETGNLRELNDLVRVPLVQLVDSSGAPYDLASSGDDRTYADLVTPKGLREVASYADAVGTNKDLVLPRDTAGATGEPSDLVRDAHAEDLLVHVWTLRDENQFMATNFRRGADPNAKGDARAEIHAFLDAGVDGIFGDYPDTAVDARDSWLEERAQQAG